MAYLRAITHTAEQSAYWAAQSKFADTVETTQVASNLGCSRVNCVFTRTTPAGTREDVCVYTMALAKIVGGGLYAVLDTAQLPTVETALDTWHGVLSNRLSSAYTLSGYVWHDHRASNPASAKGYEVIGAARRNVIKSTIMGVASARNADQVSATVTFKTASRKHWGRFYIPGIATTMMDTSFGRLGTGTVNAFANGMDAMQTTLDAAGIQLGVWTWKFQAFLPVSQFQVDDIPDIQRRRRAKQSAFRAVKP